MEVEAPDPSPETFYSDDKLQIGKENEDRISNMSEDEILAEQRRLMQSLGKPDKQF